MRKYPTAKHLCNKYFTDVTKDVTYRLRSPKRSLAPENLAYVSRYFFDKYKDEPVPWHKIMKFKEYTQKFCPVIEDSLTDPEEYVLVMVLDYNEERLMLDCAR